MKKFVLVLVLVLVLTLAIMAACGAEYDEEITELESGQTAQDFLEDLDYMLYVLENNFALFDVAYWARGVDIYAIVEDVRAEILTNSDMDAHDFYVVLTNSFRPLANIGHFWFLDLAQYEFALTAGSWQQWFYSREALARLQYPHVVSFYEQNRSRFPRSGWTGGANPTAQNIRTNFIEEGRIAHLTVSSFWWMNTPFSPHDHQILNFLADIRDYEHLIIDLRNTEGGSASNFVISMLAPNIEEDIRIEGYVFMAHGEYAAGYYERALAGGPLGPSQFPVRMYSVDTELRPIDQMLDEFDLSEFNTSDARRLDYGFRMHVDIEARHLPRFDHQPAFDGKIWFLTGPRMGSAIQISSWIAKETPGFATLVGDITGGVYGGPRTFVALPNSGIVFFMDVFYITDSHGRPLEAGAIPHYFNRDGMDALETVLAMIEEGNY